MSEKNKYITPDSVILEMKVCQLFCASGDKTGGNNDIPFNDYNW